MPLNDPLTAIIDHEGRSHLGAALLFNGAQSPSPPPGRGRASDVGGASGRWQASQGDRHRNAERRGQSYDGSLDRPPSSEAWLQKGRPCSSDPFTVGVSDGRRLPSRTPIGI